MFFSFFTTTSNTFEGKKSYERVILLLHRHWFVLLVRLLGFLFVALIPILLYFLSGWFLGDFLTGVTLGIFQIITAVYYLILWSALFYSITMYLLDYWIVSDHRIIDSEQHGFFKRTTAEIHLSKIQDVSVVIDGLIPTFLDFGQLEVQSAGASEKFFFKQIPNPNAVREQIMEAHNRFIVAHPNGVEVHEQ